MNNITRKDIHGLLKKFGIQADQAISTHLKNVPGNKSLRLRITLDDLTDYEDSVPSEKLQLQIEHEIRQVEND